MEPNELIQSIENWMDAKNATDIQIIDLKGISSLADYFIICSGNSERQVKSIADNIEYESKKINVIPKNIEGAREGRWILMDYYDVVVHIFHVQDREYYNLERLWKDGIRPSNA